MNDRVAQSPDTKRIADEVRLFYDEYPYPPPVDDLGRYRRHWENPLRRRADFHLFKPTEPYREDQNILIAGCGTSQAAKYAIRWPGAYITGIDTSATSIRHTGELKQKYNLKNLEIHQLPVEDVAELGSSFDQIVCTGVLHHLPEPDAGLSALRSVLKTDGAMHLMVYAPYGRTGVYMLQEYCHRLGILASEAEIADLSSSLRALPHDHPLAHLLRNAPDFRTQAALADALLHPQDRAYSVPQLLDFIDRNGLVFGRWLRQAPYAHQCGSLATIPHTSRLKQLPAPEQYAAVELFRGTMVRHSAVVYRNDRSSESQPIRFETGDWAGYVPIRLPMTISVRKNLPPGAAAVLINQSHTYTDLYLPVDGKEERLFEAIDGKRTITEIACMTETLEPSQKLPEYARTLFERLWWYDQVVFDASGQKSVTEE